LFFGYFYVIITHYPNEKYTMTILKTFDINATTANFPGMSYEQAIVSVHEGIEEGAIGQVKTHHMQLCPQNRGVLSAEFCEKIKDVFPQTQFRVHANARVHPVLEMFDASYDMTDKRVMKYMKSLKEVNTLIGAPIYSYHAGRRTTTYAQMRANVLNLQEYLQIPVAVEGLYPSKRDDWFISSLSDYEALLTDEMNYALDLSHLQIVCSKEKVYDIDLIRSLLSDEKCLEIHVSDNNCIADSHSKLEGEKWWFEAIQGANIHSHTHFFTEGNHIRPENRIKPRDVEYE
jgi:hypothetical protein